MERPSSNVCRRQVGSQQFGELTGSNRRLEIVALSLGALLGLQPQELLSRLHALRNHFQTETSSHIDHRADNVGEGSTRARKRASFSRNAISTRLRFVMSVPVPQ